VNALGIVVDCKLALEMLAAVLPMTLFMKIVFK
jgi:hypothetical protein